MLSLLICGAQSYTHVTDRITDRVQITDSIFQNLILWNDNGGAVSLVGFVNTIDLKRCLFANCTVVGGSGGAIFVSDQPEPLELKTVCFKSCAASISGAVLHADLSNRVIFQFASCHRCGFPSHSQGKGILNLAADSSSDMNVEKCNFTDSFFLPEQSESAVLYLKPAGQISMHGCEFRHFFSSSLFLLKEDSQSIDHNVQNTNFIGQNYGGVLVRLIKNANQNSVTFTNVYIKGFTHQIKLLESLEPLQTRLLVFKNFQFDEGIETTYNDFISYELMHPQQPVPVVNSYNNYCDLPSVMFTEPVQDRFGFFSYLKNHIYQMF